MVFLFLLQILNCWHSCEKKSLDNLFKKENLTGTETYQSLFRLGLNIYP